MNKVSAAGFMVHNAEKKSVMQRLAVVDHMLSRFDKELGHQQKQIKKLQERYLCTSSLNQGEIVKKVSG